VRCWFYATLKYLLLVPLEPPLENTRYSQRGSVLLRIHTTMRPPESQQVRRYVKRMFNCLKEISLISWPGGWRMCVSASQCLDGQEGCCYEYTAISTVLLPSLLSEIVLDPKATSEIILFAGHESSIWNSPASIADGFGSNASLQKRKP
jgi:hypothetical protein